MYKAGISGKHHEYFRENKVGALGVKKNFLRTVLLGFFTLMLISGIARGEIAVVLQKAVNICLECIGLG